MSIPPFLIPIIVGVFAQLLKTFLNQEWRSENRNRFDALPQYGGMPSAHTAFATSLATIVSLTDGVMSGTFAVAAGLLIFILDDALRLRVFLGRFGVAIRRLVKLLPKGEKENIPHIEGRIGHKVSEVIAGALIGIFLTIIIWNFIWI